MKTIKMFITVMMTLVLCLTGCSSSGGNEGGSSTENTSKNSQINIDDISWSVDEGVVDGKRYVLLSYTNNTKYTISEFEITFKAKKGLKEEEKEKFYSDLKEAYEIDDEEFEEIKNSEIGMHAKSEKLVKSGESISNANCYYFTGYVYVKNFDHYSLVQPDIATIKYVADGKIYTTYYDFQSKKYTNEANQEKAYQWNETDLGKKIPKPETEILKSSFTDDEDYFSADVYGFTLDDFNDYANKCKEFGYTVDVYAHDGFYSATDSEGFSIVLNYDEDDFKMSIQLNAPNDQNSDNQE